MPPCGLRGTMPRIASGCCWLPMWTTSSELAEDPQQPMPHTQDTCPLFTKKTAKNNVAFVFFVFYLEAASLWTVGVSECP